MNILAGITSVISMAGCLLSLCNGNWIAAMYAASTTGWCWIYLLSWRNSLWVSPVKSEMQWNENHGDQSRIGSGDQRYYCAKTSPNQCTDLRRELY